MFFGEGRNTIIRSQDKEQNDTNMSRFDSSQTSETSMSNSNSTSPSGGGGDVLLKWGHRKRSRVSRAAMEDSSSSVHTKQRKINHSVSAPIVPKLSSSTMPPPPPLVSSNGKGRKDSPRNMEDLSAAGSDSPPRNSQSSNPVVSNSRSSAPKQCHSGIERSNRKMPSSGSAKSQKPSGSSTTQAPERLNCHGDSASLQSEQEGRVLPTAPATSLVANGDKVTVEVIEWPRLYISLSRKEKEDDFLAMKGTKIPQRPKKRPKNIDKTLQYCFPGMWLSDLTKSRYEVREKKSGKKQQKRRGLKGMDNLDSDSE